MKKKHIIAILIVLLVAILSVNFVSDGGIHLSVKDFL